LRALRLLPLALSVLALVGSLAGAGRGEKAPSAEPPFSYRPKLRVGESLEPFLRHLTPGGDAFPEEKEAEELAACLAQLGARLRENPGRVAEVADFLLAPGFRGGRLLPPEEVAVATHPSLRIFRARTMPQDLGLDARSFADELRTLLEDFREVAVAEFLITSLDLKRDKGVATTDVRFDMVGPGKQAWRAERLGRWRLQWRRDAASWRVTEWTATEHLRSSASAPTTASSARRICG